VPIVNAPDARSNSNVHTGSRAGPLNDRNDCPPSPLRYTPSCVARKIRPDAGSMAMSIAENWGNMPPSSTRGCGSLHVTPPSLLVTNFPLPIP
jgi:hypothetical protein